MMKARPLQVYDDYATQEGGPQGNSALDAEVAEARKWLVQLNSVRRRQRGRQCTAWTSLHCSCAQDEPRPSDDNP